MRDKGGTEDEEGKRRKDNEKHIECISLHSFTTSTYSLILCTNRRDGRSSIRARSTMGLGPERFRSRPRR